MYGLVDCPVDYDKLVASVKKHEGLSLTPYLDTTGHVTIGYGKNISAGITENDANYFLGQDLQSAIRTAEAQDWWPIVQSSDARARALVECLFNLGLSRFNGFTKAVAALLAGDFDTASAELLNSLWHSQVGRRAEVLAAMVKTGHD